MTTAQKAIDLLRNQMTGNDLRQLSDVDLSVLESICHHWQAMSAIERDKRSNAAQPVMEKPSPERL